MKENIKVEKFQNLDVEDLTKLLEIGIEQDDFESIPSENKPYTILGKGDFGYAEKMKSKLNNNKEYSVKKLFIKKEGLNKELIREIFFMLSSDNPYIIKLYGYFQGIEKIEKLKDIYKEDQNNLFKNEKNDKKIYFLISDYIPHGTLENFYINCRQNNKKIDQKFIIKIFKQLLIGLKYLHEKQIMHRDIKLDNILLDENDDIKIIDFGISAIYPEGNNKMKISTSLISDFTKVGRRDFVAPEILNDKIQNFDYKVDIFSLGLTMLCLVSNKHPISLENNKRVIYKTDIDYNVYDIYLVNLIRKMILENPILRPDANEALKELERIETYINDPSPLNKKKLHSLYEPENTTNLINIGLKAEDFEPVKTEKTKPGENYTILGKGNYGYCELMKSKLNNKLYAIKRLPVKQEMPKDFIRETTFMIRLEHPNLIRMFGYFQCVEKIEKLKSIYKDSSKSEYQNDTEDKKMYFMVLEYMANGSLDDYYAKIKSQKKYFEEEFIIKTLKQLLDGLIYLQKMGIIHRDIKADNLLFDENNNLKITDFGISALMRGKNADEQEIIPNSEEPLFSNLTHVGPRMFCAPEMLDKNSKFDSKVDIFSLGLTMLCFVSKDIPIKMKPTRVINQNLVFVDKYNPYLIKLIKRMILVDPRLRPDAANAYEELQKIEAFIKDPNNQLLKQYLDDKNNPQNYKSQTIKQNISFQQNNKNNNINNQKYNNNNNNIYSPQNKNPFFINQLNNNQIMINYFLPNPDKINNNLYNPFFGNGNIKNNMNILFQKNNPGILSNSKNESLKMNNIYNKQYKNSSLMCVLKCLYYCFKDCFDNIYSNISFSCYNNPNIKKMSKTLIFILNHIKFMEKDPQNQNQLNELNNSLKKFRHQFSFIAKNFEGIDEITPYIAFSEIYTKLTKESKIHSYNNPSNNLKKLEEFNGIDRNNFPEVYKEIKNLKASKDSPFVDYFCFIQIDTLHCRNPNCNALDGAVITWEYLLHIDASLSGNISNLVFNYFSEKIPEDYYTCHTCLINNRQIQKSSFLMKPKFLVIHFEGEEMGTKNLDPYIDLSQLSFPNNSIGPTKYSLYASIFKNLYSHIYFAAIKKEDGFYYYNKGIFSKADTENFINVNPYIVFYKGEN